MNCSETTAQKDETPAMDEKMKTLIAIGAATAANCIPCFEHKGLGKYKITVYSVFIRQNKEGLRMKTSTLVRNGISEELVGL
ncbi:MAG: hypothetical protein WA081_05995, partial [Desulfosalsimonadaceae bacterium]